MSSTDSTKQDGKSTTSIVIDQGGGSFTAYININGKSTTVKSKQMFLELMQNPATHQKYYDFLMSKGLDKYITSNGTFNDFSSADPSEYPNICRMLTDAYEIVANEANPGTNGFDQKIVRQTGKIRAKLHNPENKKLEALWNTAMNKSFTSVGWNYQLLTNEKEAELEAHAIFKLNELPINPDKFVGISVGTSSTQVCTSSDDDVNSACNSILGSKPTTDEQIKIAAGEVAKTPEQFETQFYELFSQLIDEHTTAYVHGSFGYAVNTLFKLASAHTKKIELSLVFKHVHDYAMSGKSVKLNTYGMFVNMIYEFEKNNFHVNMLKGFFDAMTKTKITDVYISAKKYNSTEPENQLKLVTSWVKSGLLIGFDNTPTQPDNRVVQLVKELAELNGIAVSDTQAMITLVEGILSDMN